MFLIKPLMKYSCVVLLAALFCACAPSDRKNEGELLPVEVSAVRAENRALDDVLKSFGSISYKTKTDVTCTVSGTVTAFFVKEGGYRNKGTKARAAAQRAARTAERTMYERARFGKRIARACPRKAPRRNARSRRPSARRRKIENTYRAKRARIGIVKRYVFE